MFSYVVKGIKIKITAKSRSLRSLCFEDRKKKVTRNAPEKFQDFRETGPRPVSVFGQRLDRGRRSLECGKSTCFLEENYTYSEEQAVIFVVVGTRLSSDGK